MGGSGGSEGSDVKAGDLLDVGQQAAQTIGAQMQKGVNFNILQTLKAFNLANESFNKAIEETKVTTAKAKAEQAPYKFASYQALDGYMDTLGLARPKIGSAALAASMERKAEMDSIERRALETMQKFGEDFPGFRGVGGNYKGAQKLANSRSERISQIMRMTTGGKIPRASKESMAMFEELRNNPMLKDIVMTAGAAAGQIPALSGSTRAQGQQNGEGGSGGSFGGTSGAPAGFKGTGVGGSGSAAMNANGGMSTDVAAAFGGSSQMFPDKQTSKQMKELERLGVINGLQFIGGYPNEYGPLTIDDINGKNLNETQKWMLQNTRYNPDGTIYQTPDSPIMAMDIIQRRIPSVLNMGVSSMGGPVSAERAAKLRQWSNEFQPILDEYYKTLSMFPKWQEESAMAAEMGLFGTPEII